MNRHDAAIAIAGCEDDVAVARFASAARHAGGPVTVMIGRVFAVQAEVGSDRPVRPRTSELVR